MPRLTTPSGEIAYDDAGRGTPVLLIHGLGSSRQDWGEQLPALRRFHRVIALDLRGHGASSRPRAAFDMKDLAMDARAIIERVIGKPAHVLGLSLGGMVAFQLAVDAPHLVSSLTIVNSGPEVVPRTFKEHAMVWSRLALSRLLSMRGMGSFVSKRLFPKAEQEPQRRAFVDAFADNHKPSYLAALDAIVGWTVLERIDAIEARTLVVSGDRDYTPVELKQRYVERMPNAELAVVEDSGHATPVDQPDRFNQLVLSFLGRVDAAPVLQASSVPAFEPAHAVAP